MLRPISIRYANPQDARAIAEIHIASRQAAYANFIPPAILQALSLTEREAFWSKYLMEGGKILVLIINDQILGFASINAARDRDLSNPSVGEISTFYLHPSVFHQGYGRHLCLAALERLEDMGFSQAYVWVIEENTHARHYYEEIGFKATQRKKIVAYSHDVDVIEIRYMIQLRSPVHFEPVKEGDLITIAEWLNAPHLRNWWRDSLDKQYIIDKYKSRIDDPLVVPFIIFYRDQAIGFIQYYNANQLDKNWWLDETQSTLGIDIFIGDINYMNGDVDSLIVRTFVRRLFANPDIKRIIADADPINAHAKALYQNVGFQSVPDVKTPDGLLHYVLVRSA